MKIEKFKVIFRPEDKEVEVEKGSTLLEASRKAKVFVSSICGGDGICGKCRLIIKEGKVNTNPTTLLNRDEIRKGYALACQSTVQGDVEVEIPPESRIEERKILVDKDSQRFRALYPAAKDKVFFKYDPLIQKIYLELPPPTLHDSLADQQRIYREIRRKKNITIMQTGLKVIRQIPQIMRTSKGKITATLGMRGETTEVIQIEEGNTTKNNFAVAVDVGTSTVVAHLLNLNNSKTIDAEATYNSQRVYGEEVTRRIIYGELKGYDRLREAITGDINNLITSLISKNRVKLHDVMGILCAGNTTMMHLLLGLDPSHIRREPYVAASTLPPPIRAAEVGIKINPRGLLYCLPSIGAWVGADITAGILATGINQADSITMLIDIGTNGEVVLGSREWMICCSASAGPAFEGSGVKDGMRAAEGAIEKVKIIDAHQIEFSTIGDIKPKGLCGSGLIDTLAELFRMGYINRSGRLNPEATSRIRERDSELEFILVPRPNTQTGDDIVLSEPDIENLISAKAAIFSGAHILAHSMNLEFDDIDLIYLAGGFGSYLNKEKAVMIGLIPDVSPEKIQFVGNASVTGAKMALLSQEALEMAQQISQSVTYYDLITYPHYMDEFLSAKFIPHTDLTKFPSLAEKIKEAL
ncbi:Na(+)-translocating NADH-quinone reductase subunit F [subsurface metagenome]